MIRNVIDYMLAKMELRELIVKFGWKQLICLDIY